MTEGALASATARIRTRTLLICGALAAIHVILQFFTVTPLTASAVMFPPLYALLAGVHSIMPFLARRLTRTPGSATITAAAAGVFVGMTHPAGPMMTVPLLIVGITTDLVVWRTCTATQPTRQWRFYAAAIVAAIPLFAVSLSVFSPGHLTAFFIIGSLVGRLLGESAAAAIAHLIEHGMRRHGIVRTSA